MHTPYFEQPSSNIAVSKPTSNKTKFIILKYISCCFKIGLQAACIQIMFDLIDSITDYSGPGDQDISKSQIKRKLLIIFAIIEIILSFCFILIQICFQFDEKNVFRVK